MAGRHLALFALLAGTVCVTSAHAEAADDDGRTIIVVGDAAATEAEQQVRKTPGGADIVTYDEYADRSLASLRDTLSFSPGVYTQPRFGQEVRISIRGSGLSRGYHMRGLTLLQDGVPINMADDNGDFQELEPIFFDHLEVYRGANALRFGSGTLGGAINGVTPNGHDAPGAYLRGDAGSFGMLRGLVSMGGASGPADFWAGASVDRSDGDRQHARRRSFRFHGNVGLQLGERVETRFYASINNLNQQLPGALPLDLVLSAPRTGNFAGDQQRDIDSLRLQNRTTIDLGDARLEAGIFLNVKSLFHPIYQVIDQESVDRGGYARLHWEKGPIELTLGAEARFGDVKSRRFVNVDGKRGAKTFEADQDARTANLYGELRYRPVETVSLIVGGIYADGMRRQHETFNSAAGGADDVLGRADFSTFSPRFGVLFEPSRAVQFYANYSRSAEFPGFIELAQVNAFVPVRAQTAWTAEIGTRGRSGPVSWDVSFYRADIEGELLQFSLASDIPASTFNAGKTRHQGIEAALSIEPTPWLRLRQVYQYNDFRFRDDAQYGDNRLPVVPRHVYRAELRLGGDALHVAPNVEWVPQGAWADYSNATRTRGYALLGLTAGMRVSEGFDLFLDVRNLTGKRAAGDISATITATSDSVIYYPVERRAIYGGVRARF
jgi:iron complex outermembrane receptor protein